MKNTKVLEMLNNGKIEELKALLQDEIFTEGLASKSGSKKRYAAMKKYFTYVKSHNKALTMPCVIDYDKEKYTSFVNGYSIALTRETAGEMDHFTDSKSYFDLSKFIVLDGEKKTVDFTKVLAEAKSKGYKIKKSEVDGNDFTYVMKYDGAFYKIGLLDATFSIIDNGENVEVYHKEGNRVAPIIIKNDIGYAVVLPMNFEEEDFENKGKIVIEVEGK